METIDNNQLKFLLEIIESLQKWFIQNILSWDAVIEISIITGLAALSVLTVKFIKTKTKRKNEESDDTKAKVIIDRFLNKYAFVLIFPFLLTLSIPILKFFKVHYNFITTTATLVFTWFIVNWLSSIIKNRIASKFIAVVSWLSAALISLGVFKKSIKFLESISFKAGDTNISAYLVIKGIFAFIIFIWFAKLISEFTTKKISRSQTISPSVKVLSGKIVTISFYAAAILFTLSTIGVNLTAFAFFSGAVGVGVGLGLQKIVSNILSGFIILMDDSIKPGDIIQLDDKFGAVTELGARYISVKAWDGTEYLIPNEEIISGRVINWTHSNKKILIIVEVGVSYKSDIHKVKDLILQSTKQFHRILQTKGDEPSCFLTSFGDNSVNFKLAFWIEDPENGMANIKSEILFKIWDLFAENNIEIPFPQRDVHIIKD